MAKHHLQIAHEGPILKGVGRKGMTQMMRRETLQVAAIRRCSHGPLDVGFVAAPAHQFICPWVATNALGREKPGPAFGMGCVGILFMQQSGQGNGDVFGKILRGEGLGQTQLPLQGTSKTLREKHDTALCCPWIDGCGGGGFLSPGL